MGRMGLKTQHDTQDPDLLIDLLVDTVTRRLKGSGIAEGLAVDIALECGEDTRSAFGGGTVYIPTGHNAQLRSRDDRIMQAFDGTNYKALAKDFGLTENRIRQIIVRRRRLKAGQA
jgi:Mor family transcriptional regulator